MDQNTILEAILRLFRSFPANGKVDSDTIRDYCEAAVAYPASVVVDVVDRFRDGKVEGQSLEFAPAIPQLISEVRRVSELRRDIARLPAPVTRPSYGGMTPFQLRQQKAFNENSNRPVIKENVTLDEFKAMSAARKLPAGATWVALLATIYGPEPIKAAGE